MQGNVYVLFEQPNESRAQNYVPAEWLDFDFLSDPQLTNHDKEETEQMLELKGICVDFCDPHDEIG